MQVLRAGATNCTELVAAAIDALVENKPQTCGWNYGVPVVIQNKAVCFEADKTVYKTSRWLN